MCLDSFFFIVILFGYKQFFKTSFKKKKYNYTFINFPQITNNRHEKSNLSFANTENFTSWAGRQRFLRR